MQSKDTLPLLRSVAELSQLALAIGTSIDLTENCEYFFQHLMSRKDLIAVNVWTAQKRDSALRLPTGLYLSNGGWDDMAGPPGH